MTSSTESVEPGLSPGRGREPRVVVAGIGGGGCSFVNRISKMGKRGMRTIAVNSDRLHLELVDADCKLLIGNDRVHGTGCGADVELGRTCMAEAAEELSELMGAPDVAFIAVGLGGGTGTGGCTVAARVAKESGALVVGVAYIPFKAERGRHETARRALEDFRKVSDAVMVMENDRLLTMAPNLPIDEAFLAFDRLLVEKISEMMEMMALSEKLLETTRILEALPAEGLAMVQCGEGAGSVCEAVNHPLLELECVACSTLTSHDEKRVGELLARELKEGTLQMPRTNVLVGTRPGSAGGVRRVVPLVAGARTYPGAGPAGAGPRPPRSPRQTVLLGGSWETGE